MNRMRGWGLLLAIAVPLLILYSWSHLGAEKTRINLERYEAWVNSDAHLLLGPLYDYFAKHRQPAAAGDVPLPAVPTNIGVKAWHLQADSTLLVELDFKLEGQAVRLRYVPMVRGPNGFYYDCVRDGSSVQLPRLCSAEVLKSEADIPAQLAANAQRVQDMPAVLNASGVPMTSGVEAGSVVVVPTNAADLSPCGFQCVKPQSCVTPRPLACSRTVDDGKSRHQEVMATGEDFRGSQFSTRGAADAACAQALGTDFHVADAASLHGALKLTGGNEYWVHNDVRTENNCWSSDAR